MRINKVKRKAHKQLKDLLATQGRSDLFIVEFVEATEDIDDESVHILFSVTFTLCDTLHTHMIALRASPDKGIMMNGASRAELEPITYGNLMAQMYFDLALNLC
jgi:hypothetical protein